MFLPIDAYELPYEYGRTPIDVLARGFGRVEYSEANVVL
jgi:hypothetical protein